MLAFPTMLTDAAESAGIPVPPNPDDYDPEEFPRFHFFCNAQLCRPMTPGAHWENAKIVAAIPEEKLRTITMGDLEQLGWKF